MNYKATPNLLLEALAYLGRKATNNNFDNIDQKIKQRKLQYNTSFKENFTKLKELALRIDKTISMEENTLQKLFANFEGFPFNTIGSSSIAFLLFYQVLEEFNGDFDALIKEMKSFSPERIAYNIAIALDIIDNVQPITELTDREFLDGVLSLTIPSESKIAILDTYRNYLEYLSETSKYISEVIEALKKEELLLKEIIYNFSSEINITGCDEYLKSTSHLKPIEKIEYCIRPFIFGMDTVLTSNSSIETIHVYCGVLRKELLEMLNQNISYVDDVYEAYHILGDRTRFDILCYLRKQSAYGQELSKQFKLSRNTIHHHMSKLINFGLVICTTDGNRIYYSINTETFETLISHQKILFCSEK